MKRLLGIAAFGCLLAAGAAQAEMLTNDSVIQLAEIGLGDEALIAKIKTSENTFDVSTDALVALKGKGLSEPGNRRNDFGERGRESDGGRGGFVSTPRIHPCRIRRAFTCWSTGKLI